MNIPLNLPQLKEAIARAEAAAGTDKMSVFIVVQGPEGVSHHLRVVKVSHHDFVDPGEVNWSLFLTVE